MFDVPTYGILTAGCVRVRWSEIDGLRNAPGCYRGQNLGPLVRHADDQTVLAVAAVVRAIEAAGWNERSFANWGVVASGRSFGCVRFHAAIKRFRRLGAPGTSPLPPVQLSLHAMAGTISIGLALHGPSFGTSGQTSQLGETLLAGIGMVEREEVEGAWIVVADLDPEPILNEKGEVTNEVYGQAAALAIGRDGGALELTLGPGQREETSLRSLVDWIQTPALSAWPCAVAGVGVAEICRRESAMQSRLSNRVA